MWPVCSVTYLPGLYQIAAQFGRERADSAWPSDRDSGLPSDRDSGPHSAQTPESHSAQNRTPPPAHAPPFIRARDPNPLHTMAPNRFRTAFPIPSRNVPFRPSSRAYLIATPPSFPYQKQCIIRVHTAEITPGVSAQ